MVVAAGQTSEEAQETAAPVLRPPARQGQHRRRWIVLNSRCWLEFRAGLSAE